MFSQISQLAVASAGLALLQSLLVVIVLVMAAYALHLVIKLLRSRLDQGDGADGTRPRD